MGIHYHLQLHMPKITSGEVFHSRSLEDKTNGM